MQNIALKQFQFNHVDNPVEYHISIIRIKSILDSVSEFDFKNVHQNEVQQDTMKLNLKKSTCHGAIPVKILKQI